MAVYQRGAGAHVAERVQAEPGSDEEKRLERLADDPASGWRRVDDEQPAKKESGDSGGEQGDQPKRPAQSANKDEWVKWAVSQGADQAEAESTRKEDLIKVYGGE